LNFGLLRSRPVFACNESGQNLVIVDRDGIFFVGAASCRDGRGGSPIMPQNRRPACSKATPAYPPQFVSLPPAGKQQGLENQA
jgi:hypothetical protein